MLDIHSTENLKCKHKLIGGGKISPSHSDLYTRNTRLYVLMKSVCRAAVFMLLLVLPVACQQACLIPDDEAEENSRGKDELTEEPKDSTEVDIDVTGNGWGAPIDVNFGFGAAQQEGGNG